MTIKKRIATFVLVLAVILAIGGELLLSLFAVKANAAFYKETGVLEDLKKDSTFNEADYPAIDNNYSLKVIQLTEGDAGVINLPDSDSTTKQQSSRQYGTGIKTET